MHYIYSAIQKAVEYKYKYRDNIGYVLMFHEVSDNAVEWNSQNYVIGFSSFKSLIENIQSNDIPLLSVDNLLAEQPDRGVYVTFDDMSSSAFESAVPYLEDNNVPYCCFIATDLIGKIHYLEHHNLKYLINSHLCTIGSHTCSHSRLRSLHIEDRLAEFINSKEILEKKCNTTVNFLAYPYGSRSACPCKCTELAEEAGYSMAFSTYSMPLNQGYIGRHPFFIPRINVNENNWLSILHRISGDFS